ncbi:MAG: single-stranded DNA-binding protein [Candidatus Moranbacteria bacterium]|nr:single-stranded DNA-binding protein [Candidatus Moranbacteria bacterium]
MNVNKAILVGRLTRDPDIRTTQSGQTVVTIGLATNTFWTDKSGQKQERTEFHNVVLWGRLAEIAGQYLTKGQEAYFEGRLQTRTYTGKDGVERRATEIIAENMQLGSRPRGEGVSPSSAAAAQKKELTEEIPTINLDEEQGEVKIENVPF